MPPRSRIHALLVLATQGLACSASAAELSADCKPAVAAMEKSLVADHTIVATRGADTMRGVTVGGQSWIQVQGAWRKSPVSPKESAEMAHENLKGAKQFSCKALPDTVIEGTPVVVYATHTVSGDDDVMDSRVAISKATGLVVSVESRAGGETGFGMVTHYGYGNVKAPM